MSLSQLHRVAAALALACVTPMLQGGVGLRQNFDERLLAAHNRERDAMSTMRPVVGSPKRSRSGWPGENLDVSTPLGINADRKRSRLRSK